LETEPVLPLNLTVSSTSNSEPDPDNVMTLVVVLRTCNRENSTVAETAAAEMPN